MLFLLVFILDVSSFWYNFSSVWRIHFNIYFRVGQLVTNSLNFLSSEKVFIFILEGYFCWIVNPGLIVLFFQHCKDIVPFCSSHSGFWWKFHCYLTHCSLNLCILKAWIWGWFVTQQYKNTHLYNPHWTSFSSLKAHHLLLGFCTCGSLFVKTMPSHMFTLHCTLPNEPYHLLTFQLLGVSSSKSSSRDFISLY